MKAAKAAGFARFVTGRKIERVDLQAYVDENDSGRQLQTIYDPVIHLDNGGRIRFVVQETDNGDGYGVMPVYYPPKANS